MGHVWHGLSVMVFFITHLYGLIIALHLAPPLFTILWLVVIHPHHLHLFIPFSIRVRSLYSTYEQSILSPYLLLSSPLPSSPQFACATTKLITSIRHLIHAMPCHTTLSFSCEPEHYD